MSNFYDFIKGLKRTSVLFLVLILSFSTKMALAQSVNINVNIIPPYSPYYSDYAGPNASKVLLILQNLTNTTKTIKLTGQLEGDNGIRISTKSNYVPLQPIILNPNQTRQLNGLALKDIFDLNSLNVYGVDKVKLVQTSRLPEGNYTFCVQAVDMATNQVISSNAPLGCTSIGISYPEPPILISPSASVFATTPQSVVFNWINAGFVPIGIQYVLQVAEMPLPSSDPNQVLNSASFPLINKTLSGFSYVLSPSDPPLKMNKSYAWRVKAVDPAGKATFKNNGVSGANVFTYSNTSDITPMAKLGPPTLIYPDANAKLVSASVDNLVFKWTTPRNTPRGTKYRLQLVELSAIDSDPVKAFNSGVLLMNIPLSEKLYMRAKTDPELKIGKRYAWRVQATGKGTFINDGFSEIHTFDYIASSGPDEALASAPVMISPVNGESFTQMDNLSQPSIKVDWKPTNLTSSVTYDIVISKIPFNVEPKIAVEANLQGVFAYSQAATQFLLRDPAQNPNQSKSITSAKLEDGASYALQVTVRGKDAAGKDVRFANLGKSNVVQFTYHEKPKKTPEIPAPIESTIAGRFLYRFKEIGEQPVNTALGFPKVTSTVLFNGPSLGSPTTVNYKVDYDSYPDYAASGRFPTKGIEKPLKNVAVKFTYTILQANSSNPKSLSDLKEVEQSKSETVNGYYTKYVQPGNEKVYYDKVINPNYFRLKEDGTFNLTFINNYKLGFIGSKGGVSYFGVIRPLIIEDGYFTSSEILLFPKVGKTMTMPDEVVFVNAYNAEVLVKTRIGIKNQAVEAGNILANYPVEVLDQHKVITGIVQGSGDLKSYTIVDNLLTMPVEANADSYATQTREGFPVVDMAKTGNDGFARIKNLLANHRHLVGAALNPYEGNLNYQPGFIAFPPSSPKEKDQGDKTPAIITEAYNLSEHYQSPMFSTGFSPVTIKAQLSVAPKKPEIYLRAIAKQGGNVIGIPEVYVNVISYPVSTNKKIIDETYKTDKNGYFQMSDLPEGYERTIILMKAGFQDKKVADHQNIALGQRYPESAEQEMTAGGSVFARVVNEKGESVSCNLKIGDGPFIKSAIGSFTVENCQTGWRSVQVVPTVDNYFAESLSPVIKTNGDWTIVTNPAGAATNTIVLKEKLHRVRFKIVDENGNPVAESCTSVGTSLNVCYPSDPKTGLTNEIEVASPDNEFHIRTVASGYVTYDNYKNIPICKTGEIIPIKLIRAKTIVGYVLDAKTQKPVKNARVYTISGTNEDGQIQNDTYTDEKGYYVLSGAINQSMFFDYSTGMNIQSPIDVYAVKGGEDAYQRQKQTVVLGYGMGPNTVSNVVFNLTSLDMKAEIWGLPVEINTLDEGSLPFSLKISGAFVKIPDNATFKTALSNAQLPFKNVLVYIDKKTAPDGTSKYIFVPTTNEISVQSNAFKVMAFNKFSCEVLGSDQFFQYPLLKITKNKNGLGVLRGFVTSELASFNFSYNYNGKFLLDDDKAQTFGASILPSAVDVLGAENSFTPLNKYKLKALYGVSNFNIHNFSAQFKSGFFDKDAFNIDANVNLQIPLVGASSMPAGQFKVMQNGIVWNQYTGNINIPLESWTVLGKGLIYDANQGGFKVLEGSLKTDLPQVMLKDLMIMPTTVDLGANKLTGQEALTLANVAPLKLAPGAMMTLNYDAAAPFDQKPHYRLNLTSPGESVAYVDDLPGIGATSVNINMLSAYSDGQHKTILVEPTKVNYFNVISQTVKGIEVAQDFFTFIGNTDLEIPGAPNNVTGRFRYYKNPSDSKADHNGVVLAVEKLQTDVEMEGKVKFEGLKFQIAPDELLVEGNVYIYKNNLNDAIKDLSGRLTKHPGSIRMDFLPGQKIKMGGKAIDIVEGHNVVEGNKWSLLTFTGQANDFKANGKNLFKDGQNLVDFQVKGAIENVKASDKKLQFTDINTPFGALQIGFDFGAGIFNGSLQFNNANIVLGPVTLQDGSMDLQIDSKGFILVGAINDAQITAPLPSFLIGGFKSGIALGYYTGKLPTYMTDKLLGVTLYNKLPDAFNEGLKGSYINVMKSINKDQLPKLPGPSLKSIPVVGSFIPVFDFSAGIDVYVLVDFNDKLKVDISGKAFASASCLYDLSLCTIGLAGGAEGKFDLKYIGGSLEGSLLFAITAHLSYCVDSFDVGAQLLLEKNGSGFSFKPSLK